MLFSKRKFKFQLFLTFCEYIKFLNRKIIYICTGISNILIKLNLCVNYTYIYIKQFNGSITYIYIFLPDFYIYMHIINVLQNIKIKMSLYIYISIY